MTTSVRLGLLGALLASMTLVAPLEAQRRPRSPEDRARLEQRIRAQMGRMIQERLGLSEEEGEALSEIVGDFERERRALFREEQATRRQVEALREGDGDPATAPELLDQMLSLRIREAELFGREQEALLELLTPMQVLELQELRADFGRRIRSLRNGRDDDASRRRRRGGNGDERGAEPFRFGSWGNVDGSTGVGLSL